MALFNLQKISRLASNRQTYLRGVASYNAGHVQNISRTRSDFYAEILSADVQNDHDEQLYHVEVCFDYEGRPEYYECGCPAFNSTDGACKHICAVLVHKYYADMVSGIRTGADLMKQQEEDRRRTDDAALNMIDRYMERQAAQMVVDNAHLPEQVRLTPQLRINGQSALLSFTVSITKPYIIKDLRDFADKMLSHEIVSYGKELRFYHHIDSFSQESRPLLRFLLSQLGAMPPQQHAIRELTLSPVGLDAFFELTEGRSISCIVHGHAKMRQLRNGNPDIDITVVHDDTREGYRLSADLPPVTLCGAVRRYVLTDREICACTTAFGDAVGGLCDAVQAAQGSLFIADRDMPSFCSGVLPAVRPFVTLSGDIDRLDAFLPDPLSAEVYLDAHGQNEIVAKLFYVYGERRINPYAAETAEDIARDKLGEFKVRLIVEKQFSALLPEEERLVFRGDDDDIFRFVTEGVEQMQSIAEIYATDRFKAIGLAPPPSVSVGVSLNDDWLRLTLRADGPDTEEWQTVLASYRTRRRYHRLKNGQYLDLRDPSLHAMTELADGLALTGEQLVGGDIRLPSYRALYLDRVLRENPALSMSRDVYFRSLVRNMGAVADSEFTPPTSLLHILRSYQRTGFRWLKTLKQYGFGGILADDMGLGKTLQMLSLLLDAKERGETLPSLVVCPTSLVYNWQKEAARFTPDLRVLPIVGDAQTRAALIAGSERYDLLITSYDLLKRDVEQYEGITFAYHVLDEAQCIKNATTQNARSVKAIRSAHRFALTGTPIENRLSELWSIFDFLMPGFLYRYAQFRERLEIPIVKERDEEAMHRLSNMVSPFILRRLKDEVLSELPPKIETVVDTPLAEEQRRLYAANVALLRDELTEKGLGDNRIRVLAMLMKLRQICCSPRLCYENYEGDSPKLDTCVDLLCEARDSGHKVLVFSQFTMLLDLLKERLDAIGFTYFELRGSTPKDKRARMVEQFNRDETAAFLISLKAGGTGLNLTGADVVIHLDPWWNVAAQNQATDRAHRIGQKNRVQVYKLISTDTIEERILEMQQRKQELAEAVVAEADGSITDMTAEELMELF